MFRHSPSQFAASLRQLTGFRQARGRDPETEQAWLRVAISTIALAWCGYLIHSDGELTRGLMLAIAAAAAAAVIGIGMLVALSRSRVNAIPLRYLGIVTDMTALSVGMAGADEGGVPMIGVYLWVTVGNGFRFGPKYLMVAYWLQLTGFGLQLLFVPFWIEHRVIGLGLLLALAIVPLYVLVLLSRLTAQKDAAEQLSNAKSRFVANVSHELRTPLTGIFAVYELLNTRVKTTEEHELISMLGNAIFTLKSSVDAVLQMSKLEAGAERSQPASFNLWQLLREIEKIGRPQAVAKGLDWRLRIDSALPAVAYGDEQHLSHVLGNLINNALKFTHQGSVEIHATRQGDLTRFEVRDTGIGIPEEQQKHLFERFVQVDNSAKRRYGGTGLGTSIARDLVHLMGGQLGVQSAPGVGSTFWVEIPLSMPSENPSPRDLAGRRNVLVIEADSMQAAPIEKIMAEAGVTPSFVRVDDVRTTLPSSRTLLATVLYMPATTAVDLVQRADGVALDSPWLVISPTYTEAQRSALIRCGAADLLRDSVTPLELRVALGALAGYGEPATSAKALPVASPRALSILLADDNQSNQLLLARILRDAGHSVSTVGSGEAAFDMMMKDSVDVAILDLNMPDMTGPDVIKLFRAGSVGARHLPILILSADATPAARTESLLAGADGFLTKPVSAASLVAAVEGLSEKRLPLETERTHAEMTIVVDDSGGVVDYERVAALRHIARGDQEFLNRYLNAAFEEIEAAVCDVSTLVKRGDVRGARDALHVIEGTGASVGGSALVRSCSKVRELLANETNASENATLSDFVDVYEKTKCLVLASAANDQAREPHQPRRRQRTY